MLPYIIAFSLCGLFLKFSTRKKMGLLAVLALSIPCLLAALRDFSVGTDTESYIDTFQSMEFVRSVKELLAIISLGVMEELYYVWNYAVYALTDNPNVFLFLTQFLMLYNIYRAGKMLKLPPHICVIIWLLTYYNFSLNGMRQAVAMSFCLYSLACLLGGKSKRAWWNIVVAYGFHHTALVFLFVPMLYWLTKKYRRFTSSYFFKLLVVSLCITLLLGFSFLLETLIGSGDMYEKYSKYGDSEAYGSSFPISDMALCVFNYVMFRWAMRKKQWTPAFILADYLLLLCPFICLSGLYSTYLVRIVYYFSSTVTILFPLLMSKVRTNRLWRTGIKTFYPLYWLLVTAVGINGVYPYRSQLIRYFIFLINP